MASLGIHGLRFARTRPDVASGRHQRDQQSKALVVDRKSEYSIDYDLMFDKFGFVSLFASIPAEAGRAAAENETIEVVLIDADIVGLRRLTVVQRVLARKVIVVAAPDAEIDSESGDVVLVRNPLMIRELEKVIASL